MAGNSIGTLFKITTLGESDGEALGGVIDGCPPNIILDFEAIQNELDRRRPGQSAIVTQRKEGDDPNEDLGYQLIITKVNTIEAIDSDTWDLIDVALDTNGQYDGWETVLVK